MTLEILISCMHQTDLSIIRDSKVFSDALIINQCDRNEMLEDKSSGHTIRMISTTERGLSKSRNLAIQNATGDICLLCDDDEEFLADYERKICHAFEMLPDADVIAFNIVNQPCRLKKRTQRLFYLDLLKIKSWQIAFRRTSILARGVCFDPLMGAGSGNGAQEENKFLTDCLKAGLKIYYVPYEIASVAQTESTWFHGFTEQFFYDRGGTTRYFMGTFLSVLYAVYYLTAKYPEYKNDISFIKASRALIRGLCDNRITRQKEAKDVPNT